jgi:hypothetical protein
LICVVESGGQSIKTAATMYGMSKTVLWRKAKLMKKSVKKKSTGYSQDQKLAAVQAIKMGEKTHKVANDFVRNSIS